jgi:dTDP-4-dehydrorhamnose reductase
MASAILNFMRPAILLIGKNGQIGAALESCLPKIGEVVALGRKQLGLSEPDEIRRTIRELAPQVIVNAAAYTAVDRAESEESEARAINANAPAVIAEAAKKLGALVVHYSTDYVFDGREISPYQETDATNPINVYGQTKLEGEQAIRASGVNHFIFRTEWVYSTRGRNFLLAILRQATQSEELRVVRDQIGAPTWSHEIAAATTNILARHWNGGADPSALSKRTGTYHMTAAGEASWYDFACAILEECSQAPQLPSWVHTATEGKSLVARGVVPIATNEYPTAARRPAYSVLSNSRLSTTFGIELPDWRTQLHAAFAGTTGPESRTD